VIGVPPLFDLVFTTGEIRNYRDTLRGDATKMARLNALLKERGILKGDSKYYVSLTLSEADIKKTLDAWDDALAVMAKE